MHEPARGIIPADAGSTSDKPADDTGQTDHPRGCGEHFVRSSNLSDPGGSSPRMRGAPHYGVHRLTGHGIIPADAGST